MEGDELQPRKGIDVFTTLCEEAGVDRAAAVADYIRESAYTWANLLFAVAIPRNDSIDRVARSRLAGRLVLERRGADSNLDRIAFSRYWQA